MFKDVCDHFWEYQISSKKGVQARCIKCDLEHVFTWYEWRKILKESKYLGTTSFNNQ